MRKQKGRIEQFNRKWYLRYREYRIIDGVLEKQTTSPLSWPRHDTLKVPAR